MNPQDRIPYRRLLHRLAAEKLRNDPAFFDECVDRLRRWRQTSSPSLMSRRAQWEEAFAQGTDRVCEIALGTSDWHDAMRQSSPMGFIFTPQERLNFLKHWKDFDSKPAGTADSLTSNGP